MDINARNSYGNTPFFNAIESRAPLEIIRLLLDAGANCLLEGYDIFQRKMRTPFEVAKDPQVKRLLLTTAIQSSLGNYLKTQSSLTMFHPTVVTHVIKKLIDYVEGAICLDELNKNKSQIQKLGNPWAKFFEDAIQLIPTLSTEKKEEKKL